MAERIQIEEYLSTKPALPLLDVRTPAEYEQGHIPGALNVPLFSDEERAEVGTLYKQVSPEAAFLRGLELAGPKMRHYVERALELVPDRRVAVHCWRGGQRSGSMAWLLERAGFEVFVLEGGYKAYRKYIRQALGSGCQQIWILGGPTGSGKTKILWEIAALEEYVLDLEGLARHKGSAFGALGERPQPTVEHFENLLHAGYRLVPDEARLWLENESQSIGRVYLPDPFWDRMARAPLLQIEMPLEWRIENLVEDYAQYPKSELAEAFERITKRLGGQHVNAALAALEADDYHEAARIALRYYDKAYARSTAKRGNGPIYRLQAPARDAKSIARAAVSYVKSLMNAGEN